jgi:hypothetical protein
MKKFSKGSLVRIGGATAIGLCILVVAGFLCLSHGHREFLNAHYTGSQIYRLGALMRSYGQMYGRMPGPSLNEAVGKLKEFAKNENAGDSIDWSTFIKNQDAWGHPYIYQWRNDGKAIQLRSMGSNGQDDLGQGDDLVANIKLGKNAGLLLNPHGKQEKADEQRQ